jgi:hypothetical protein
MKIDNFMHCRQVNLAKFEYHQIGVFQIDAFVCSQPDLSVPALHHQRIEPASILRVKLSQILTNQYPISHRCSVVVYIVSKCAR